MATLARQLLTAEEYLAIERAAEYKSEFFAGEMFAMAGASEAHILITHNVAGELRTLLKKRPCRIYPNDMRVKVSDTGLYTYPDVAVVCGERHFEDGHHDTLLNPTLIVEVLSPSTEAYDRGDKFAQYRRLESLREYVLIAQDRPRIERYTRQAEGDQWLLTEVSGLQGSVPFVSIGCELALAEVYDKVEFPESSGSLGRGRPGEPLPDRR
jgi:Uma2 family endonuclease